jgi:hypothetical protein
MTRRTTQSRRGVAIIIVLTMISIALAVSYAMIRTQITTTQVQSNSGRRLEARSAAMAGLAAGIRKMHLNAWGGVGTTLTGSVDSNDSYSVTFTAGDDSLTVASPNYSDWHVRVTVVSTGTSVSPANSQISSSHQAKAVVQLVPRALGSQPTNWSQVASYTVYQTNNGQFTMQVPGRIEGALRLQGSVQLGNNYSWSSSARSRYFSDLNAMRTARNEVQTVTVSNASGGTYRLQFNGATTSNISYNASSSAVQTALCNLGTIGSSNVSVSGNNGGPYTVTFMSSLGNQNVSQMTTSSVSLVGSGASVSVNLVTQGSVGYGDYRPLVGPISLPTSATDATNLALISALGVTTSNINVAAMSLSLPTTLPTYRIYTGGPTYNVPQVSSNLSNTTLAPNPTTNPLGIYFCGQNTTLGSNVAVNGTLITAGDMNLTGSNVGFTPVNLRPLSGTSTPIRLPAAVARQNLTIASGASSAVNGFLLVGQRFDVNAGVEATSFALNGRLVTNEFVLDRRNEWNFSGTSWNWLYAFFLSQYSDQDAIQFFPVYVAYVGCNPIPTLTLRPDPSSLTEHWQNLANPIYVAHASDPGLRWDVIRMETGD